MATNNFKIPTAEVLPTDDDNLNHAPPVVAPCALLREKASGEVYVYTDAMAARGDLVEAYHGDAQIAAQSAPPPPPVKRAVSRKAQAGVQLELPLGQPLPPSAVGRALDAALSVSS
jgi:hypothetical protein